MSILARLSCRLWWCSSYPLAIQRDSQLVQLFAETAVIRNTLADPADYSWRSFWICKEALWLLVSVSTQTCLIKLMPCFLSFLWTSKYAYLILGHRALSWAGFRCTVHLEWWRGSWVSFPLDYSRKPCLELGVKCYAFGFPWRTRLIHLGSDFALWTSSPKIFHCIY